MIARRRPIFVASQPRRCAGEEAGHGGACLACGTKPGDLCQAPPALRYQAAKARA